MIVKNHDSYLVDIFEINGVVLSVNWSTEILDAKIFTNKDGIYNYLKNVNKSLLEDIEIINI